MNFEWKNILKQQKNLDIEFDCISNTLDGYMYTADGIRRDTGNEENYIIYDCSMKNSEFKYSLFKETIKEYINYRPIIVFRNWDHEREAYHKNYDCLNAKEKKIFLDLFNKKISLYSDITD